MINNPKIDKIHQGRFFMTFDPFRVAIISSTPYGAPWNEGVRNLTRRIAHDLVQRGNHVTVITPRPKQALQPGETKENVVYVSRVPELSRLLRGLAQSRSWITSSLAVRRLDPQPDVILLIASVFSTLGIRTQLIKLFCAKPLLMYVTGLGKPRMGYDVGLRADRIVVGTEFLQKWFPEAGVIHPLVPVHLTEPVVSRSGRLEGCFTVLFLGSFERERGVETLLQAIALVKGRTTKRIRLILAWAGLGNKKNILDLIEFLQIGSIVDLRGQVDTQEIYAEADVVVIPRISEERMAFPVRLVESLRMNVPVIVSRTCGMEALVEGWGLSAEPGNPESLAQAILLVLNDPLLYRQLQKNCGKAMQKYDADLALEKLGNELRGLVKRD